MTHPLRQTALFLILLGTLATAQAADDPVLIESANVKITRSDYDAELQRLPDDLRGAFSTSKPRIEKLLQSMLVNRTLAEDARKEGLDKDPQTQRLLALQLEKFLAELRVERLMRAWNAEFDKNEAVNLKHAQELYVADKEKFRVPEQVNVS